MIDLDKLHEDLKNMSIPNNEMIAWIPLLSNELRAARKVVEAARGLFDLCENDIGMDKPELTDLRVVLKELGGEK